MPTEANTVLSDEQIAEIEARANDATVAPWLFGDYGAEMYAPNAGNKIIGLFGDAEDYSEEPHDDDYNNGVFTAHARADIPALCQTVKALRAENEKFRAELAAKTHDLNEQIIERVGDLNARTEDRDTSREELVARGVKRLNDQFRSRAIELCKAKAEVHDMHCSTQFNQHLECDCAVKQFLVLAAELEKLK